MMSAYEHEDRCIGCKAATEIEGLRCILHNPRDEAELARVAGERVAIVFDLPEDREVRT